MDYKKFILPEMKTPFDAETASRDAQRQLRILLLVASFLSVFFLGLCHTIFSLPTFLIGLVITAFGLFGLWTFHERVEDTEMQRAESKTLLPAEELVLDPEGFHWVQKGHQPNRVNIPWENVRKVSFDPLNSFILYDRNQRLEFPRIMFENQREIMEFIEQNLDLKKTTINRRWRDEVYTAVHYTR